MPVNFKSNSFFDVVIFSGFDVKYEKQVNPSLIGDTAKDALNKMKESYETYRQNLNLNYGQFLGKTEANLDSLYNPQLSSEVRLGVAKKLSELAKKRINVKESQFSPIYRFFHKLGQLFQRHGFVTKGEWGFELASRIQRANSGMYMKLLDQTIFRGAWGYIEMSPKTILNEMKDKINGLETKEFMQVLSEVIFKKKEDLIFGSKNKLIFYYNLSEEKKNIFKTALCYRDDFYSQAYDMIEGAEDEEILSFIKEMNLVLPSYEYVMEKYRMQENENHCVQSFFKVILEATIKSYLNAKAYEEIAALTNTLELKMMLSSPKLLDDQDMQNLRKNIRCFS